MKKRTLGVMCGLMAGIIDLIPMLIQKLSWDANFSAFSLWIVSGFLIGTTNLKIKGAFKGTLISFLVLLPSAILIGAKEPLSLIPIVIMTLILGSIVGFAIEKFGR
jgi:hypothetical protein